MYRPLRLLQSLRPIFYPGVWFWQIWGPAGADGFYLLQFVLVYLYLFNIFVLSSCFTLTFELRSTLITFAFIMLSWALEMFTKAKSLILCGTFSSAASTGVSSPSPYLSVCWKAWTRRRVSSTERPTGKSLMVICLKMPLSSITNRPLRAPTTK